MALQPSARPAGSTHVLRFQGVVTPGNAIATFPKDNGELTTGGAVGDARSMRFLFADPTDLDDETTRFPSFVYDDTMPAGAAPHASVATTVNGLIVNAGELSIASKTWAQNMRIDIKGLSSNIVSFGTTVAAGLDIVLDTLTSGLGLNTGLPVLIIPVVLSGDEVASVTVDIYIEIPHTVHR